MSEIVFDYKEVGKRYRLLSDGWIPTISVTESDTGGSMLDRIRRSRRKNRPEATECADDCCHPDHAHK